MEVMSSETQELNKGDKGRLFGISRIPSNENPISKGPYVLSIRHIQRLWLNHAYSLIL